jgi:hypothetical protein
MTRKFARLMAVVALFLVVSASAPVRAYDLSGQWTVTWAGDASNTNPMVLKLQDTRFKGTYGSDNGDTCSVTGVLRPEDQRLAIQIVCPDWDIRMEGGVSADGNVITGAYQAYVDSSGMFSMAKK